MKLTRKKLRKLIQEHFWIANKDIADIKSMRKHLSPDERKTADDLFLSDPAMGKTLGGAPPDMLGPEKPSWSVDLNEPDWNVTDAPFYLDEILDEQYDDTSIDEIAQRLENEYDVNEKFAHDLLVPIDNQGQPIKKSYTPVMNRKMYEYYLKRWIRGQLEGDERFELFPDDTVYVKPSYEDYEPY